MCHISVCKSQNLIDSASLLNGHIFRWTTGKFISGNECERCQCYGHANECYFDPQIESERKSQNTVGKYSGGGVCINCRDNTDGVNCEKCLPGVVVPKQSSF